MSHYFEPLEDPILEAASQILSAWSYETDSWRDYVTINAHRVPEFIEEVSRQIDHLRAIGAIPEKPEPDRGGRDG